MERLKELRKLKKITMKQLGNIIGAAESTISLYENGKREPDNATLSKIADYFNVSVDYILGRTDEPNGSILDKQLEGVMFALWGEVRDLTEEEKQDILDFVKFTKSKRKDNTD